jgi:hypothetical protein
MREKHIIGDFRGFFEGVEKSRPHRKTSKHIFSYYHRDPCIRLIAQRAHRIVFIRYHKRHVIVCNTENLIRLLATRHLFGHYH